MSTFSDYNSYKKYLPSYNSWRNNQDLKDAKKEEYLKRHPELINQQEIEKGKALIQAIDIMDEYSQKRAEDMELTTETLLGYASQFIFLGLISLSTAFCFLKPVQKQIKNFSNRFKSQKVKEFIPYVTPIAMTIAMMSIASVPLNSWAAKIEVGASKKGRFEAMRKELDNPNNFAILTEEQQKEVQSKAQKIKLPKEENTVKKGLKDIKALFGENQAYQKERTKFINELKEQAKHKNDVMSEKEILDAKKDQQLLTNLVDKIDIASQDYAENAEMALSILSSGLLSLSSLGTLISDKIIAKLPLKSEKSKVIAQGGASILAFLPGLIIAFTSTKLQKDASRIGRFKIKQELLNNPSQLIYLDEEKINSIKDSDVNLNKKNKSGLIQFIKQIRKDNKEYQKYLKTKAIEEKKITQAKKEIKLSEEQLKEAKRIQRNTFKTFNKVDEKSQQYSESVEALGKSIETPIGLIMGSVAMACAVPYLIKSTNSKLKSEQLSNMMKYIVITFSTVIPATLINLMVTKEQKKASRVADMLAINEMQDYKEFV